MDPCLQHSNEPLNSIFSLTSEVLGEGFCVHITFPETLKEAVSLEAGLDFAGTTV